MPDRPARTAPVFEEFCAPWLDRAAGRLPVWGRHPELANALTAQLSEVAARTLTRELGVWREAGRLRGETAADRWRDFSTRVLTHPDVRRQLQATYPLLFPLLDTVTDHFCRNVGEGLARLRADRQSAGSEVTHIATGLSDPHAEGRSVICFTFDDQKKLIYKPRSVRGEVWWADCVRWWNASGVEPELTLRAPHAEDHGDHGWCEYIGTCEEEAASSAWFYRLGAHMALTWFFGIGDCHFGNFIAAGVHPVLVDAECVGSAFWHPKLPEVPANLPPIFTPVWKTPLTGGLFPPWILPKVAGQPLYLAPGIGGAEDRPMPVKRPVWHGVGTDALRMELAAGLLTSSRTRSGTPTSPQEIAEGFRAAARHLLARRQEILEGMQDQRNPLRIRPRILLRNTTVYQQILEATSGPKYLVSPGSRRSALETVRKTPVIGGTEPEGLVDAELACLEVQTFPRFVVNPDGTHIVSEDGASQLLECTEEAARERALRHWNELTEERIAWNAAVLSGACRQAAEVRVVFPGSDRRFLAAALTIGDALERQVIRTPEGASWMGLTADGQGNILPQMPGGDFASGSAGVAVFLARLAEATGSPRWMDLAVEAMRFSDRVWTLCAEVDGGVPWSAYYGAGSLLLAGGMSASLAAHPSVRPILTRWIEAADRDRSWLEMNGDHLGGLPGWTFALANLAPDFPAARELLKPTLDRLLEPSLSAELTTPGLAHGTAGWVMAVIAAARALGDDNAMRAAQETIATFPEKWAQFETRPSVQKDTPGGWCNGAIGLMAAAAEHPATADCARAFFDKARPWFADGHGGHHLCCGEAGRILLLTRAADLLAAPELAAEARRCASALLDHADKNGFLILQGIPERLTIPGWLNGISGVGAALLSAHSLLSSLGASQRS